MNRRLLSLYAHPDDELLGLGGTLAHLAQQGVAITHVCSTRGEEGEIAPHVNISRDQLGVTRESEMGCAAKTLGIEELIFLDYRDSGMDGSEANSNPTAFINAPADEVVSQLVAIIRRVRPHVILTFEPYGGYGHPDHIAISRHSHAALETAADPSYRPDLGAAWQTPKLFYPIVRLETMQQAADYLTNRGYQVNFVEGLAERGKKGWNSDIYHYVQDISETFDIKWAGFNCHQTQLRMEGMFGKLSAEQDGLRDIFRYEYFAQAYPPLNNSQQLPHLFHDIPE